MHMARLFTINRCHQRVVTILNELTTNFHPLLFPINRCHQRVVTVGDRDLQRLRQAVSNQ